MKVYGKKAEKLVELLVSAEKIFPRVISIL